MKEKFEDWLKDITYRDWRITVGVDDSRCYLQVSFEEADMTSDSPEKLPQYGRKWLLSPHMTKSEVIQTAFKAVLTAEEHEAREKFFYRGRAIFGPHFHVDRLVEICGALDLRAPVPVKEAARA